MIPIEVVLRMGGGEKRKNYGKKLAKIYDKHMCK
jgi:hypothetical protein